ncbi:hypothetical protein [Bacillus cereus]|uniref:hypothetical protein n=1 Tax=Bacillus cereus TaxID=1396 RepID=UPI001F20D3B5|nr:hypothetical protein [Bacillus cereus]BCB35590.1 hypothetical protein BCM0045_0485 [Bacillus cereus]BCB98399.1 hypothetical protein BCM0057_0482 [Bacillus cereus]BCC21892.1 hypothetical protein BCM0079_0485 [Bacillus cereus]BCC33503.1 hypothetical protein BCM0105_0493 [Bacillus cereus]
MRRNVITYSLFAGKRNNDNCIEQEFSKILKAVDEYSENGYLKRLYPEMKLIFSAFYADYQDERKIDFNNLLQTINNGGCHVVLVLGSIDSFSISELFRLEEICTVQNCELVFESDN